MADSYGTSQLAALVEAQVGICDEMIALSQREQQALALLMPAHLPQLLAAQDDCAERFAKVQESLDAAVRAAAGDVGLDEDKEGAPDIRTLLPHLPLDAQARLGALRGVLEERAYTLAVLNAQNALLVRSGLLQVDQTVALLAHALGEPRSYGAAGSVCLPASTNTLLLNRQV